MTKGGVWHHHVDMRRRAFLAHSVAATAGAVITGRAFGAPAHAAGHGHHRSWPEVRFSVLSGMNVAEEAMIGARLATDPAPRALDRMTVPALAVSMEDDRFETAPAGRHIVASVKGAELILYPTGGQIWIGWQDELFAVVGGFLGRPENQKSRP